MNAMTAANAANLPDGASRLQEAAQPQVLAEGLALRTRRGVVYQNVDLALQPGGLAAVVGPSGSGRTALLLTLAGRIRFTDGRAAVCGLDVARDPRKVRRLVGLGIFPEVNELDDTTSIGAQVKAEAVLHRLPHDERAVKNLLERFRIVAEPGTHIGDLSRAEQILLGAGLGLLHKPPVLMVDEADLNLTLAEQALVWSVLRELADGGTTVLASCVEAPAPGRADVVVDLGGAR
jgi:ABC-2 type transport system ATP-binding protein